MAYTVRYTTTAASEFAKLEKADQKRIKARVDKLTENPRPDGVKKLKGREDSYRIRVGDYRVIYEIQDQELLVIVVTVAPRNEAYR